MIRLLFENTGQKTRHRRLSALLGSLQAAMSVKLSPIGSETKAHAAIALASLAALAGYLSSQSSMRQPLKMLLTIRVSPFTYGCRHVPSRL